MKLSISEVRRRLPALVRQIRRDGDTRVQITVREEVVAELRAAQPQPEPGSAAKRLLELVGRLPKCRGHKFNTSSQIKKYLYGRKAKSTLRLTALVLLSALPGLAWAHGGRGLDTYGCHLDRQRSTYHCHRAPFAGRQFPSLQVMLRELRALEAEKKRDAAESATTPSAKEPTEGCIIERETEEQAHE